MKETLKLLKQGFESSSQTTLEFTQFVNTFKKEFKKEMQSVNAQNFTFYKGHFNIYGFFTINSQMFYFSLSDVRGKEYVSTINLLYRTAEHDKDWTGGGNRYVKIEDGMALKMDLK